MSHLRTQIRDAVATAVTGLTTTGANVFKHRTYDVPQSALPCLLVTSGDEALEYLSMGKGGRSVRVMATVTVEILTTGLSEPEDVTDAAYMEVFEALSGSTLSGIVKDFRLESVELIAPDDGEQPASGLALEWAAEYHFNESDIEVSI